MTGMSAIALILAFVVLVFIAGFAVGFAVRARISARHRARAYRYRSLYPIGAREGRFTKLDPDEAMELDQTGPSLVPPEVEQDGPKSNVFTARRHREE